MKKNLITILFLLTSCATVQYNIEHELGIRGYHFMCIDKQYYAYHPRTFHTIEVMEDNEIKKCFKDDLADV